MSQTLGEIGGGSVLFFWSNNFPKEDKKKTDPKFQKFRKILPSTQLFFEEHVVTALSIG
jgi:glycerol uptake facilitator-like aquaporin